MTRAECVHGWEWLHVSPCELDEPSDWLGGRRYLREHCPWCALWVSARVAPLLEVAPVAQIGAL